MAKTLSILPECTFVRRRTIPVCTFGHAATFGADEEIVVNYIRNQEDEDKRLEQLTLFRRVTTNGGQIIF